MSIFHQTRGFIQSSESAHTWGYNGLFETLLWDGSNLRDLQEHEDRLRRSLQSLYHVELELMDTDLITKELIERNEMSGLARVRYVVDFSEGAPIQSIEVVAYQQPFGAAKLMTSSFKPDSQSPRSGHKSCFYQDYASALAVARAQGADEALLFNQLGVLSEGATSNVFFVSEGVVHTPNLSAGCLPGIVRDLVIKKLTAHGMEVREDSYLQQDVINANHVFITNSLRRIQYVESLDGKHYDLPSDPLVTLLNSI